MFNIAIDGPAGAGKSTIAKRVAKTLSFVYADTGAMYRAMAYFLLEKNVDPSDRAAVSAICGEADITIEYHDGEQIVMLNGANVNQYLRTERVSEAASKCSANPDVRAKLLDTQKELAKKQNVVMDGRDIGTVVLPEAQVKIFLTASVEVRAKRRYDELIQRGENAVLEDIAKEIEERDYRDMNRETAPLKQAEDAVLVDTSFMTIEEAANAILDIFYLKAADEA